MKPLELAMKFLEIFFSGRDPEELIPLLAPDLDFKGPLFRFDSSRTYVDALKKDPPVDSEYSLIHSFHKASSVCLIYQFSKPGVSVPMAQTFEIVDGKITSILLVFDSAAFSSTLSP